jgi:hypothetical protein
VGRVVFTWKAEPAVDWSEIESRLREISTPSFQSSDLPVEPSATLANDPPAPNRPRVTATSDRPEMPSLPTWRAYARAEHVKAN